MALVSFFIKGKPASSALSADDVNLPKMSHIKWLAIIFNSLFFRLYHYSTTNLPMPPCAILTPSTEDQVDPPWLMTKICRMIDEFSDVNEGEKEFMKMWNLHVQHYT